MRIAAERQPTDDEDGDIQRLLKFADTEGDISSLLTDEEITTLGHKVVEDWEMDDASRSEWKTTVERAFSRAAQERPELAKSYPWEGASNVDYPILTLASQQFDARAYPALAKGDEAVGIKVFGDKPKPLPQDTSQVPPEALPMLKALFAANENWARKTARAKRVKTYLNYVLFYGMEGWEDSLDTLLTQLPIAGTAFKKVYYDPAKGVCSDYVNPLRLTVAMDTQSLKRCPRITQDFDLYPYEIRQKQASGFFRDVELHADATSEDDEKSRVILEQHRLHDLDGDGIDEPYIITVDKETSELLRIEAAFDEDDVFIEGDKIVRIERYVPFVKFPFLRDPKGRFYEIGFGQLLEPLTAVINSSINELIDAGNAQVAGGGFIASGLRLQGPGQSSALKWRPGEYKIVNMQGGGLKDAVWERTLPNPSPIIMQLLELMLGAAKEIANIKDVLTGDAPSTAPVGTTLALIEQGLQQFTAIYKRVYRSMREEFQLIYRCEAKWGGKKSAQLYSDILDDPEADFEADFAQAGMDITPISDPTVVTRQQRLAKANVIQQVALAFPNAVNAQEAAKRMFEAADIDDVEALIVQPQPPPGMAEEIENTQADTAQKMTTAELNQAKTVETLAKAGAVTGEHHEQGKMDGIQGGLGGVESPAGDAMGAEGAEIGGGSPEDGMGGDVMGEPGVGPAAAEGIDSAG